MKNTKHEYSSAQLNLPEALAQKVRDFGLVIPDHELADKGREREPHITLKCGFTFDSPAKARDSLYKFTQAHFWLGKTQIFNLEDHDVLVIEARGDHLIEMNSALCELPHVDAFAEYKPHVTVAYLKPGFGHKYVGQPIFNGLFGMQSEVAFSSRSGKRSTIKLDALKLKAGPPDEPRDEEGKWTAGGGVLGKMEMVHGKKDQLSSELASGSAGSAEIKKKHNIVLPKNGKPSDKRVLAALDQMGYKVTGAETRLVGNKFVTIHELSTPDGGRAFAKWDDVRQFVYEGQSDAARAESMKPSPYEEQRHTNAIAQIKTINDNFKNVSYQQIDHDVREHLAPLSKDQVADAYHSIFGTRSPEKTKQKLIDATVRRIRDRKESFDRISEIGRKSLDPYSTLIEIFKAGYNPAQPRGADGKWTFVAGYTGLKNKPSAFRSSPQAPQGAGQRSSGSPGQSTKQQNPESPSQPRVKPATQPKQSPVAGQAGRPAANIPQNSNPDRMEMVHGRKDALSNILTSGQANPANLPQSQNGGSLQSKIELGAKSSGLSPEKQAEHLATIKNVLGAMPEAAVSKIGKNLRKVNFHGDVRSMTESLAIKSKKVQAALESGRLIGGAYDHRSGTVNLDGGRELGHETDRSAAELHAHELTHAIDHRRVISNSPEWQSAWKNELASGQLCKYASQDATEGFAEFGRLAYGLQVSPSELRAKFPQAAAVFDKLGLMPSGKNPMPSKLPEAFSKPINDGTVHADQLLGKRSPVKTPAIEPVIESRKVTQSINAAKGKKNAVLPSPQALAQHYDLSVKNGYGNRADKGIEQFRAANPSKDAASQKIKDMATQHGLDVSQVGEGHYRLSQKNGKASFDVKVSDDKSPKQMPSSSAGVHLSTSLHPEVFKNRLQEAATKADALGKGIYVRGKTQDRLKLELAAHGIDTAKPAAERSAKSIQVANDHFAKTVTHPTEENVFNLASQLKSMHPDDVLEFAKANGLRGKTSDTLARESLIANQSRSRWQQECRKEGINVKEFKQTAANIREEENKRIEQYNSVLSSENIKKARDLADSGKDYHSWPNFDTMAESEATEVAPDLFISSGGVRWTDDGLEVNHHEKGNALSERYWNMLIGGHQPYMTKEESFQKAFNDIMEQKHYESSLPKAEPKASSKRKPKKELEEAPF